MFSQGRNKHSKNRYNRYIAIRVHYDRFDTSHHMDEFSILRIPDMGDPDLYPVPAGLFWLGDWGKGWDIKQKWEDVGSKLSQGLYLKACRTEKSLAQV